MMKVECLVYTYHLGRIWREGVVYDYPDDKTPPKRRFKVLEAPKEKAKEKPENSDPEKEKLIARASELGIGPPSTLSRWGVDKLKDEIGRAEAALAAARVGGTGA